MIAKKISADVSGKFHQTLKRLVNHYFLTTTLIKSQFFIKHPRTQQTSLSGATTPQHLFAKEL